MCGIVGVVGVQEASWVSRMNDLVHHRGPDDFGEYRDPKSELAFAMRRLSILDLEGGRQPMSNEDETVWMVYNGEIYNAAEFRPELTRGHHFKTSHSDTEVLIHLYEEKGENMLQSLNGMFSFVIYDKKKQILFGARDRFGIKPLYYMKQTQLFAFASELKCFLALPSLEREIDRSSLYHYMSLHYIPGENSILTGVKRLLPGHYFKYDLRTKELIIRQYWDLDVTKKENRGENEWCEKIREGLRDSVRRRMLSDVPIGCSLSGGIDSATLVGLMAELGHSQIKTYSLGFAGEKEEGWNELPLAREVAKRWGTEHHELILNPDQLLDDLIDMVWSLDEPYGGGLPSWYIFKFMRESVTVGLTGTGGDEDFGNYGKFRSLENPWARMPLKRKPFIRSYFNSSYYFKDEIKRSAVFYGETKGIPDTAHILQGVYDQAGSRNIRDSVAYMDFKTQLTDEFLMMTDRLSMAHSLEARVPFLDHTFVEMIFRIPSSIRTRPHHLKYLLKKAVGDLLPESAQKAHKRGFVIPTALWLAGPLRPLVENLLSPERLARQGIFQPSFHQNYVRPCLDGKAGTTAQVWSALMFQLWHVVFMEEKVTEEPGFRWRELVQ